MADPQAQGKIVRWIDRRLPVFTFMRHELNEYPTPKNLNYWWNYGSLAGIMLVIMIATGIFLAMDYTPNTTMAFDSVDRIMRDVNYGWLIRYVHMNGASFFFLVTYIHIFRGLYYGSYKEPRELLWMLGVVIVLVMMATAFMGYVLPWGQLSLWGAIVITNLFSAIPVVGNDIVVWLWGGFAVDNPTLNRFYALHYLLPFVILGLAGLHLVALHTHGSNNPLGIDRKGPQDSLPFHPYYTVKDMFGLGVFLIVFCIFVFYFPNALGEPENYIRANPLQTPPEIVPEWYLLPFYAILRSVPDILFIKAKLAGVIAMFAAIFVLFAVPWLDTSPVRSARFRPIYKWVSWLLIIDVVMLGWVGAHRPEGLYIFVGRIATLYYFIHFLILLPLIGIFERPLPLPTSIGAAVIKGGGKLLAVLAMVAALGAGCARAQDEAMPPLPHQDWSFTGPFGTFDRAAQQRGFQVYSEVCSNCHSLSLLAYRDLAALGYSDDEVKAIAAQKEVTDGPDDQGDMFQRPARASDRFVPPFANDQANRAVHNGALPPDLSLIVKARKGGSDYVYGLLTGYQPAPAGVKIPDTMQYNLHFPGHQIAMPPPLSGDDVIYADGTKATLQQEALDVVTFLTWAAEPTLEERERTGAKVLIFLVVMTGVLYLAKRKIWGGVH